MKLLWDSFTPSFPSFSTFTHTLFPRESVGMWKASSGMAAGRDISGLSLPPGVRNPETMLEEAAQTSLHRIPLPRILLKPPQWLLQSLGLFLQPNKSFPTSRGLGGTNWCPGGDHSPEPGCTELFLHLQTPRKRRDCNTGCKK